MISNARLELFARYEFAFGIWFEVVSYTCFDVGDEIPTYFEMLM